MTPRRRWAGSRSPIHGTRGRPDQNGGAKSRRRPAWAYKGAMPAEDPPSLKPSSAAKRRYGTCSILEKRNSWYGQWRVRNRTITRKLGPIRTPGSRDGLTRKMAEARLRKLMAEVTVTPLFERMTVEEAGARLIRQLVTKGRKVSTTVGYESYLRVHVAPFFGDKSIGDITKEDIEEFVAVCLDNDQSIKSTRNYLGFLHSIFDFSLRKGWVIANPCKSVEKPAVADVDQDIRFLDHAELDALLAATAGSRGRRRAGTAERATRVRRLRDGERLPWKAIAPGLTDDRIERRTAGRARRHPARARRHAGRVRRQRAHANRQATHARRRRGPVRPRDAFARLATARCSMLASSESTRSRPVSRVGPPATVGSRRSGVSCTAPVCPCERFSQNYSELLGRKCGNVCTALSEPRLFSLSGRRFR